MTIYRRPTAKIFVGLAIFCIVLFVVGVILGLLNFEQPNIIVFLIGFGGTSGTLLSAVAIAEYASCIKMDDVKIVFPPAVRTIEKSGKRRICYRKIDVPFCEIKKISPQIYKGDGIISKDTVFYIFKLKNGDRFETAFFSYGKRQEREIMDLLNHHINEND